MSKHSLPETGFLKLSQIIGQKAEQGKYKRDREVIPALIPVSRGTWLAGVKTGKYPQPVKLGERSVAWRVEDIQALIDELGA